MKRLAIYGRTLNESFTDRIQTFFEILDERKGKVDIYTPFREALNEQSIELSESFGSYTKESFQPDDYDLILSIGGDGTLLDTATLVKDSKLPILGLNTGRLGFLSSINIDHMEPALEQVFKGAYMIDKRSVLKVEADDDLFGEENFALNELTLHKKDSQSMITVHVYVDGKFLNTYWADGLIIATPTGSTAYSMSCGGPIILPSSSNFIITPVATHNLTVRPVLVSDESVITLKMEARSENLLLSLDSRSVSVDKDCVVNVMKNDFEVHLVRLKNHSFLKTLRSKLHWGYDRRN